MAASKILNTSMYGNYLFFISSGFSGVTVNFMPWPVVWLCDAERSKQQEEKRIQVQQLLSLTDRTIANKVGLHFGASAH